jgi:hypothetical protein
MTLQALSPPRFVRKTQLGPGEYRRNFRQIDADVIAAVTSREADGVTPLMSKVYLRLLSVPPELWERDGVLRFAGEERGGRWLTAWEQLVAQVGVASATARKAFQWMHEQGIIGYFAGKNGVGIRVFINRAESSIGTRAAGKKILEFSRASSRGARTSADEAAFSDSFADSEVLEKDLNPRAPKNGAEQTKVVKGTPDLPPNTSFNFGPARELAKVHLSQPDISIREIAARLGHDLTTTFNEYAAQLFRREHQRTREWLESKGLPKAARVAQREAYNVLRRNGVIKEGAENLSTHASVGHNSYQPETPRTLSYGEIEEMAQACVALLETKGQSIEVTLSEMSVAAGGFLLAEDAPHVREKASALVGDTARVEQEDSQRAGRDVESS